ncbi:MAG: ABC transporter permease [Tissierellia bacterium]|nr:ABC transporter permease [Tissierellia bacterium]
MKREIIHIVLLTLRISSLSTLISAVVALPLGLALGLFENKITRFFRPLFTALTGLPPVIAGVVVFMLFSNNGIMGGLKWLYSAKVIIIAQVLIVLPIITSQIYPAVEPIRESYLLNCYGLRMKKSQIILQLLKEVSFSVLAATLAGFGRAIAEVGAVMMVGGNIRFKTRVMTSAIVLETNKGNYTMALRLGMILIVISLILSFATIYAGRRGSHD